MGPMGAVGVPLAQPDAKSSTKPRALPLPARVPSIRHQKETYLRIGTAESSTAPHPRRRHAACRSQKAIEEGIDGSRDGRE